MKFLFRTPLISLVLVPLLIEQPIWAQVATTPMPLKGSESEILQLRVVSPDNARVPAGSHKQGFTVQVTDEQGAPVPEAAVAFRLPESGVSGLFPDGSHSAVVYTDSAGIARVDSVQWGEIPGVAPVRITANKGNAHAGLLVEETLISPNTSSPMVAAEAVRSLPPSPTVHPLAVPLASPSVSVEPISPKAIAALEPSLRRPEMEPSVSVVSSSETTSIGSSKKKWIILGLVIAAGAGAGFAFASKGKSSSTTGSSSSISFGSPTVSVGHP